MTRPLARLVLALSLASPLAAEDDAKAPLAIPPELAEAVAFAERRGGELHQHDRAAWHATDAAKPGSRKWRKKLHGWITVPRAEGQRPLVRFIQEIAPGKWASHIDVDVRTTTAELVPHDPPVVLPEEEQALARARALAIAKRTRQCTKKLNTVVLRDTSGEIHVYLLAASTEGDEMVLAGHDLARVSADGRELLAWRRFSNSCMAVQRDKTAVALLTHMLSNAPVETHVFTTLNYETRLWLLTEAGVWEIAEGEIRFVEEDQP